MALEARLKEAEALQLQWGSLRFRADAHWQHWHERFEENQLAHAQSEQAEARLAVECRRHKRLMHKLGAQGAVAMHAGQAMGEWAVAARRLHALLQKCESKRQQAHEEKMWLSWQQRRLVRFEKSLEETRAQWEKAAQKLHLHAVELTNALTALPDEASSQHLVSLRPSEENPLPPQANSTLVDMAGFKGRLYPPLFGFVRKPFGPVVNPKSNTATLHKGIDIRAAKGSRIRAIGPAKVAFVGGLQGFGKLVILEHGGGFHSLVAHLKETFVEEGQQVSQGSWLGTVGGTEHPSGGGHVYFEIREMGEAQNPMEWLASIGFR
jgi:murein DD-endopeptidase MepM/ murein hydrolase activator NlpD